MALLTLWELGLETKNKEIILFVLYISVEEEEMKVEVRVIFIFCAFLCFQILSIFCMFQHYLLNNECVIFL